MLTIIEPTIFVELLSALNARMVTSQSIELVAFLSDAPVFLYPILLVVMYLSGYIRKKESKKVEKKTPTGNKKGALYLFSATVGAFIINYIIKIFFQRPRPYEELGLPIPNEELSLSNIPTDSFPSDHAAVSATIAMALWFWGKRTNNKTYTRLAIFFGVISLMMGIGRITIAIHRPTDIIMGYIIGIGVAYILLHKPLIGWCNRLRNMVISIEKYLVFKLFNHKQSD